MFTGILYFNKKGQFVIFNGLSTNTHISVFRLGKPFALDSAVLHNLHVKRNSIKYSRCE